MTAIQRRDSRKWPRARSWTSSSVICCRESFIFMLAKSLCQSEGHVSCFPRINSAAASTGFLDKSAFGLPCGWRCVSCVALGQKLALDFAHDAVQRANPALDFAQDASENRRSLDRVPEVRGSSAHKSNSQQTKNTHFLPQTQQNTPCSLPRSSPRL
jgi:hypothetical protein